MVNGRKGALTDLPWEELAAIGCVIAAMLTDDVIGITSIPLHRWAAILLGDSLNNLALCVPSVWSALRDEVAQVVAEAVHVIDSRRYPDDEFDHLCIVGVLDTDDRSRAQHPHLTKAWILALQERVVDYGAIGGHVIEHEKTIRIQIYAEVLVAYPLAGVLAKDNIGALVIASKYKSERLELQPLRG